MSSPLRSASNASTPPAGVTDVTSSAAFQGVTVQVALDERSYPIHIGAGLIDRSDLLAPALTGRTVLVVTNTTVGPLYARRVCAAVEAAGRRAVVVELPDGEQYKDWSTLNLIFDACLGERLDRKSTLIALGGGVVGDMTGFAAACYQRGIAFVQIPTTLLAQVDSSVGGKTGINHPLGKNMIGAFHQPRLVLADVATLDTLAPRELSAGLAEVIKHGAIRDAAYFDWIESSMPALLARDRAALVSAVQRSVEIKAEVVAADEREGGLRAILNFGHTFGHAIEAGLGYGEWLHGEAVGAGMVLAADASVRMGLIEPALALRLRRLVEAARLPVEPPVMARQRWLDLMAIDKKADAGAVKYILLEALGRSRITPIDAAVLDQTLTAAGAV